MIIARLLKVHSVTRRMAECFRGSLFGVRAVAARRRVGKTMGFFALLIAAPLGANAAPMAPSHLCIDNDPTCRVAGEGDGSAIKFHPGHYVIVETWTGEFDTQAKRFAFYDTLANEPSVKGVFLNQRQWSQLEGARGDYSAGFRMLDAELAKLATLGKRLIWNPNASYWSTSGSSLPSGFIPAYLQAPEYNGGAIRCATGWIARVWEQPVGDRWIAMMNAYGARYNSHPNMEMVKPFFESAVPWNSTYPAPASWDSENALRKHIITTLTAMRESWPNTMLMANTSWLRGMSTLFAALPDLKAGASGTDLYPHPYAYPGGDPHNDTESDRTYVGEGDDSGAGRGADYRGVIPYMNENQDPVFASKEGSYLPKELYDQGMRLRQTHFAWKKMWDLPDSFEGRFDRSDMSWEQYKRAVKWETGILPFLRANPRTHTTPPSALGTVVTD